LVTVDTTAVGSVSRAAWALSCVLAALLSDWLWSELFMRRDTFSNVLGALAINAIVLFALYGSAHAALSQRRLAVVLRTSVLVGFCVVVLSGLRAATVPSHAMSLNFRLGVGAVAVLVAAVGALRLDDSVADRLMRALALASIGFVLVPFAWRLASPAPRIWIGPTAAFSAAEQPRTAGATIFLLLDELGYEAAAPLAQDLRSVGLNVRYEALAAAGENTLNVIPALFSGLAFPRARPCGAATVCSESDALDLSRVKVQRADVDVTGLLLPYCDIAGLRACFQVPLPHEFGSAYRSLAVFYLRRLGMPLPEALRTPADPPSLQRQLLKQQTDFIDHSQLWASGGILYAHLPIPHPPGLDGAGKLDDDYAANIAEARTIVRSLVARAQERFGTAYSFVITSDHPLRNYWCSTGVYAAVDCSTRPEFRSNRVPLIVASPLAVSSRAISSNEQVFRILNDQAGSVLP
jgi:hypothetical protein